MGQDRERDPFLPPTMGECRPGEVKTIVGDEGNEAE